MAFSIQNMLGADLTAVYDPDSAPDYPLAPFAIGTTTKGTDASEWVYVTASSSIAQYDFVGIDENFAAAPLTDAMALDGWNIGIAQVAIATDESGWVAMRGSNITGRIAASTTVDVALYTTATAGTLSGSTTVGSKIDGLVNVVANTLTVSAAVEIIATYPRAAAL